MHLSLSHSTLQSARLQNVKILQGYGTPAENSIGATTLSSVTQLERLSIDSNSTRPKRQFGSSLRSSNSTNCNSKSYLTQSLMRQFSHDSLVHYLLTPSRFKPKPSASKGTTTSRNQSAYCKSRNGIWLH